MIFPGPWTLNKEFVEMNQEPASIPELIGRLKAKANKRGRPRNPERTIKRNYLEKKAIFPDPSPCDYSNFQRMKDNPPVKCEFYDLCATTGASCKRMNHWVQTGVFRAQLGLIDEKK